MKKITLKMLLLLVTSTLIFSCKKDKDAPAPAPKSNMSYKDYNRAMASFSGVSNEVNQAYADTGKTGSNKRTQSGCAGFKISFNSTGNPIPSFGTNYGKIVLDYNGTDCGDGIKRTGQIEIFWSGWHTSWKDSVVLKNFVSNGVLINGYRASNFNSQNSQWGIDAFDVKINGNITFSDGNSFLLNSTELWKWSNMWTANVAYEKTGSGFLRHNNSGETIYGESIKPLVYKGNCFPAFVYPVNGEMEYAIGTSKSRVNYGTGDCDKTASYIATDGTKTNFEM